MNQFVLECSRQTWSDVLQADDCQTAYTHFHNTITTLYNKHFPWGRKTITLYKSRMPWLTQALKASIRQKNKLYIRQLRHSTQHNVNTYKRYKQALNKLLKRAERDHYANLLNEFKSDTKKTWNVLKSIINKNKK
jgi:hypothetical protein